MRRAILMFLWIFWRLEMVEEGVAESMGGVGNKGEEEVCPEGSTMDMEGTDGFCRVFVWEKLLSGMSNLGKLGFEFEGEICSEVVNPGKGVGGLPVWSDQGFSSEEFIPNPTGVGVFVCWSSSEERDEGIGEGAEMIRLRSRSMKSAE